MTETLKDVLSEHAATIDPPRFDTAGIARAGATRLRRRRIVGGSLATAAVLCVAAAVPALGLLDGRDSAPPSVTGTADRQLTWAEGSVIHSESGDLETGTQVASFVDTSAGYLVVGIDGQITSWVDGVAEQVGTVPARAVVRVEMATSGSIAAWTVPEPGTDLGSHSEMTAQPSDGQTQAGVIVKVLDQRKGWGVEFPSTIREAGPDMPDMPTIAAFDGDRLYLNDATGVRRLNLTTGAEKSLHDDRNGFELADVQDGLLLFSFNTVSDAADRDALRHTVASTDLEATTPVLGVDGGDLSPDGRLVMSEDSKARSDDFTLVEVESGQDLTPAIADDYEFFLGYRWTSNDTYAAFGLRGVGEGTDQASFSADLLNCTVSTGTCNVIVDDLGMDDFAIPIGAYLGG